MICQNKRRKEDKRIIGNISSICILQDSLPLPITLNSLLRLTRSFIYPINKLYHYLSHPYYYRFNHAGSAILTDLAPKKRLTEAFGLLRVGINLGWAAGPAIGGYLAILLLYSWLFGVAALLTALALLIVLLCVVYYLHLWYNIFAGVAEYQLKYRVGD